MISGGPSTRPSFATCPMQPTRTGSRSMRRWPAGIGSRAAFLVCPLRSLRPAEISRRRPVPAPRAPMLDFGKDPRDLGEARADRFLDPGHRFLDPIGRHVVAEIQADG